MAITGESKSRLVELRKYRSSGSISDRYYTSTGSAIDGVNTTLTNLTTQPFKIVYYIGQISYTDFVDADENPIRTIFSFVPQGYTSPDFVNLPVYKDPNKSNLVANPKIDNDVFIIRQQLSVFDKNYKLKDVNNLVELTTYAGGRFFNIVNNT